MDGAAVTRLRALLVVLLVLVGAPRQAEAGEIEDLLDHAEELKEAFADKDEPRFKELVANPDVDAWLEVEQLLECGCRRNVARMVWYFLRETYGFRRLREYIETRPIEAVGWSQILEGWRLAEAEDWDALLTLDDLEGPTVPAIHRRMLKARALEARGHAVEAAELLFAAVKQAAAIGWLEPCHDLLNDAAVLARSKGRTLLSRDIYLAMVEVTREHPEKALHPQALLSLGQTIAELGRYREAWDRFDGAEQLYANIEDPPGVARVLLARSKLLLRQGEFHRALGVLDDGRLEALSPSLAADAQATLSHVHAHLGAYDVAVDEALEAVEQARALGEPSRIMLTRGTHALALARMGEPERAEGILEEVEAEARESEEFARIVVSAVVARAMVARLAGRHEDALAFHQDARRLVETNFDVLDVLEIELEHGTTLLDLGRAGEAIRVLEPTVVTSQEIASRALSARSGTLLARAHLMNGDEARAWEYAEQAMADVIGMHAGLGQGQGARAREEHAALFDLAVEAAVGLGDEGALALAIESGRAVAFLQSLESRERIRSAVIGDEFARLEEDARAELTERRVALEEAEDPSLAERAALLEAARESADDVDRLTERIWREAQRSAEIAYPKPADLPAIRAGLRPGEVLVLYAHTREEVVALVVGDGEERICELGKRSEVDGVCAGLFQALSRESAFEGATAATDEARKALVEKLALTEDTRRLLVSPVGELFRVPFALLVDDVPVAIVPSASTHLALLRDTHAPGTRVFAVGGVEYADDRGFEPLTGSLEEVAAVSEAPLKGTDATEENVREQIDDEHWRAVHFACHGTVDGERPMRSALALVRADADDGYLTATEVFGMTVSADVAVLSACRSGQGRVYPGEGLVGLSRAFMFAGTPRVIVSLWDVPDDATTLLMKRFHALHAPDDGSAPLPASEALRRAQQAVSESHPHPFYWGAWVLTGRID